jgi:sRNA-binding regulator protein Hfq
MKKIFYFILFLSSITFAQTEKTVGDFYKVTSFDQITVVLITADENKIVLKGNNADDVELVNNNGELKIRMPFGQNLKGDNVSVTVYYKNLEAIEANEGSSISSSEKIEATLFEIIVKEGSFIKLNNLEVNKLNVTSSSGAEVLVEGSAESLDVANHTGGKFYGKNFKTETTTVALNAGGLAEVYATNLVEAKTRAGGKILIFGKPKQINEKKILGGKIEQAK